MGLKVRFDILHGIFVNPACPLVLPKMTSKKMGIKKKKNYPEVKWIEVPIANFTNIMVGRENFKLKIRFLGFVLQKHFDQFQ